MKRLLLLFLIGAISGAAILRAVQHLNFEIPVPVAMLPDAAIYEGDMENGVINGHGRLRWPNGDRYEGEFKQGLFHGQGHYQFHNGADYEGEFSEGDITGFGTMVYSDKRRYTGEIKQGRANGNGKLVSGDNIYEGEFLDDKYHGKGTFTYDNGNSYTGEFKDGRFHGKGVYKTSEGRRFCGNFDNGEFTGSGEYHDEDGEFYKGEFKNWHYHGKGELLDSDGDRYIGTFEDDQINGDGEFIGADGSHYEGEFEYGMFHGSGKLKTAEGDIYEGEFEYGRYDGEGRLVYATPVDGISEVSGTWDSGRLVKTDNQALLVDPAQINEIVLYNQNELLQEQLQQLQPNSPEDIDLYFLGISGDGSEAVFRREILFVKELFDNHFGTRGRSLAMINARQTVKEYPLATNTSISRSLNGIAARMDPDNDILFIYMSSHGSRDKRFSLKQEGMELHDINAEDLAKTFKALPIRWKVIVISACFSGGFIPELADDNTLIITAAAEDKRSFGCSDRSDFTYFGEAFFKQSLPDSAGFPDAFERAVEIIKKREREVGHDPSNPQIHKPEPVLQQLRKWQSGLSRG